MKKSIPPDTVDAAGVVWETVGENIRNGEKNISTDYLKEIVNIIFPVGSVYLGENDFVLKVGHWKQVSNNARKPLILAESNLSGETVQNQEYTLKEGTSPYTVVRMYKRIS